MSLVLHPPRLGACLRTANHPQKWYTKGYNQLENIIFSSTLPDILHHYSFTASAASLPLLPTSVFLLLLLLLLPCPLPHCLCCSSSSRSSYASSLSFSSGDAASPQGKQHHYDLPTTLHVALLLLLLLLLSPLLVLPPPVLSDIDCCLAVRLMSLRCLLDQRLRRATSCLRLAC